MLDHLVTGTGRCGTYYLARLLTSLGVPCGHESVYNLHMNISTNTKFEKKIFRLSDCSRVEKLTNKPIEKWVDLNEIVADSSYLAAPFLNDRLLDYCLFIHLVRNPIDVISSFVNDGNFFSTSERTPFEKAFIVQYEEFIYSKLPHLKNMNQLQRAVRYYIDWNTIISNSLSNRFNYVHKIENGVTPELLHFLGKDGAVDYYNNTKANTWKTDKPLLKIENLPYAEELKEYAKKFGYTI